MDIMAYPFDQQVAPPPWLAMRQNLDVPALVERILENDPGTSTEKVLDILVDQRVQANGSLVARLIQECRQQQSVTASRRPAEKASSRRSGKNRAYAGAT